MMQQALAVLALLASAGCASSCAPPNPSNAPFVILERHPASEPIAAEVVSPLAPAKIKVMRALDDHPPQPIVITRDVTMQHGAQAFVAEGDQRIEFIQQAVNGSIAMTAAVDIGENVLTVFDPPLAILPAALQEGETFTGVAAMRVLAADNPQRERERGKASRTILYKSDALVAIGSRRVMAAEIEIHLQADLRFADAEERTTLYISREHGFIAAETREKVTIFGAFPRETRRRLWIAR